MDKTSITIDLQRKTKEFADQQAAAQGLASAGEYVRSLVEAEEERAGNSSASALGKVTKVKKEGTRKTDKNTFFRPFFIKP